MGLVRRAREQDDPALPAQALDGRHPGQASGAGQRQVEEQHSGPQRDDRLLERRPAAHLAHREPGDAAPEGPDVPGSARTGDHDERRAAQSDKVVGHAVAPYRNSANLFHFTGPSDRAPPGIDEDGDRGKGLMERRREIAWTKV